MGGKALATITGTMLTPGVSKNNRLYTPEAIGRAVTRMKERLADPAGLPVVMRTHHDAGDNSRLIVGRITDVTQHPDGQATYEAKLFDTTAGRDIGALINPAGPALRSTSIHGYWIGPVERKRQGDDMVESGTDLEIDAIDFTATPGVPGAQIRSVAFESVTPRADGRDAIDEDAEAILTVDAGAFSPIGEKYNTAQKQQMADNGQAMPNATGDPSYPIKTKADLRKAIKAVGRGGADHDKIRAHIISRAKDLGLTGMIPGNWNADGSLKETAPSDLGETYVVVCVGDDNGPIVKVCAANVDPDLIKKAAKKAAKIASHALANGPDDDTDSDGFTTQVGTDDGTSPDTTYDVGSDDETHTPEDTVAETWSINVNGTDMPADQVQAIVAEALAEHTQTPAPVADKPAAPAVAEQKEVAVSDTAKVVEQAAPTTPAVPDLAGIIGPIVAETVKATLKEMRKADRKARAETSETTDSEQAAVAESTEKAGKNALKENTSTTGITAEQLQEALSAERTKTVTELREQLIKEGGLPQRKGYRHVNETDETEKLTGDDLWNKRPEIWGAVFPSTHSPNVPAEPEATATA